MSIDVMTLDFINRSTKRRRAVARIGAVGMLALALATPVSAATDDDTISIEELLKSGWQVAGYTSTVDNRSTFILFRHPDKPYLVQCRTGYDVTRKPRVHSNCYELR
jgi:hypothetical protein